jgi:uncharacterized DUF497 family protein
MFEWDEDKRLLNLEKHGLDFIDVQVLFDWTWREETRRIISFRRARHGEERAYRQVHG